jgi:DNA repair ATPase RecN
VDELAATVERLSVRIDELAAAQARTEARIDELAAAQARTEARLDALTATVERLSARMDELAAAQARTEAAVAQLLEAQARTDERLDRLEERMDRLEIKVDQIGDRLTRMESLMGVTVEEESGDVVRVVLQQQGFVVESEPLTVRWNGDVDVAFHATAPSGPTYSVLIDAKTRLSRRDVESWAKRVRADSFQRHLAEAGFPAPFFVFSYGLRIDVGSRDAAERQRVGLATSRGEILPGVVVP